MNNDRFFKGDIYLTKTKEYGKIDECCLWKKDAVLLKTKHGFYVDIENCTPVDIPYLYLEDQKYKDMLFMGTKPSGDLYWEMYVDKDSIKSYVPESKNKKSTTSLFKLRKQLRKNNK